MKIESVAFFVCSPFTSRDYDRLGVEELRSSFNLVVIDCTEWFAPPGVVFHETPADSMISYHKITSRMDLDRVMVALNIDRHCAVVDMLGESRRGYMVRQILKKAGCPRIALNLGTLPTGARNILDWCSYLWRIRNRILATFILRLISQNAADPEIVVAGGRIAENSVKGGAVKVIKTHSLDYETYLRTYGENYTHNPNQAGLHIVYLDEDFVFHQDYEHLGVPYTTTQERFFPSLVRTFSYLEDLLQLPLVIAAHPRSRYDQREQFFDGRTVSKGNTPELVRNAALVVAHSSTAISFAVLFKKPVILLSSDDIVNDAAKFRTIQAFSRSLGCSLFNIDRLTRSDLVKDRLLAVDCYSYKSYRDDYLKSPNSPNIGLWKLLSSELTNYSQGSS